MTPACDCGGEMQLEYYESFKRPIEWFMRCRACQKMSAPAPTAEEAKTLWATECAARVAA